MISIAIIGADGAGKTTIANMLLESFSRPIKYLYMGINIESSNVTLPTSRVIELLKNLRDKKSGGGLPRSGSLHHKKSSVKTGFVKKIWLFIRLLNRLAEEWYRQMLSWIYRKRGYIVLYDRHFLFDFDNNGRNSDSYDLPLAEKIHRWCLHHFYPQPDLVIFLDAPAEVLFARKGEATIEFLNSRRNSFLEQGKKTRNFLQVDATQPLEKVYSTVSVEIEQFYKKFCN